VTEAKLKTQKEAMGKIHYMNPDNYLEPELAYELMPGEAPWLPH